MLEMKVTGKNVELEEDLFERFVAGECRHEVKCSSYNECIEKSEDEPLGMRTYYHQTWIKNEKCKDCKVKGFDELRGYMIKDSDSMEDGTMAALICPKCNAVLEMYPILSLKLPDLSYV